jgi:hypothetical protein
VPGAGGGDRRGAVLAAELSDPPVWPQQQPADHSDEPDEHHLQPAGEAGGVHDQVYSEEVDGRTGAEDGDVEDGRYDSVAQATDARTRWS